VAARGHAARPALATAAIAGIVAFQLLPLGIDRRFRYASGPKYDRWIALGRVLAAPEHRGKLLAVDAAGKIPYYSGLRSLDMLGLTDAHIGHQPAASFRVGHSKHDPDYVLAQRPDLVATWIDDGLDLRWGLPRARYAGAGYRLRYLAWARRYPPAEGAVVDVRGMDDARIAALVARGYSYGVAERSP
jgi:hypothetical protein